MRSRHSTNIARTLGKMRRGLGQADDFYSVDYAYADAAAVPGPSTAQGAESSWLQYLEPVMQTAREVGTSFMALQSQKQINEVNADRLRRGLQPLSASQISAMSPRVNVGLGEPERDLILWGGLALAGLAAFVLLRRR